MRHLGHRLVRHPDEVRRSLGVNQNLLLLGAVHLRQPDVGHLGDQRHPGRRLGAVLLPDVGHLGDPFPAKVRTGYCQVETLGEECPFPELKQMGCYLGEECPEPRARLKLELARQVPLVR